MTGAADADADGFSLIFFLIFKFLKFFIVLMTGAADADADGFSLFFF